MLQKKNLVVNIMWNTPYPNDFIHFYIKLNIKIVYSVLSKHDNIHKKLKFSKESKRNLANIKMTFRKTHFVSIS